MRKKTVTETAPGRVVAGTTSTYLQVTDGGLVQTPGPRSLTAGTAPVTVQVEPTQVRRPWRSTIRTVFQAGVSAAAAAPLVYAAATQESPELATGAAGTVLVVSGAVTRVMALPAVETFLRRFVPWLAAAPGNSKQSGKGA